MSLEAVGPQSRFAHIARSLLPFSLSVDDANKQLRDEDTPEVNPPSMRLSSAPRTHARTNALLICFSAATCSFQLIPSLPLPQGRLAAAFDAVAHPEEEDEDFEALAAPLAAVVGGAMLDPVLASLRRIGARRAQLAESLRSSAVQPLEEFAGDGGLRGVLLARQSYSRRVRDTDVARERFLSLGRSADPRLRAAAREELEDASMARDTALCALAAAVCAADGARRTALLRAAAASARALRDFAEAAAQELEARNSPALSSFIYLLFCTWRAWPRFLVSACL